MQTRAQKLHARKTAGASKAKTAETPKTQSKAEKAKGKTKAEKVETESEDAK